MSRVLFDPFQPKVDESAFASGVTDWKEYYGDIKEDLPPSMPATLGNIAHTKCFVDAKHYGKVVTQSLHTGFLIYAMNAPIIWFSKKQNISERSTFGS